MNTLQKVLISTVAGFMAHQAEAKSIHNSCLTMSDVTAGSETGAFVTNEDQLTSSTVTDEMRLHSITTCHTDGQVTGLQFHMAMDPYEAVGEEVYDMAPLGVMTGTCEPLELPEGLNKIKASLNSAESGVSIMYKIFDGVLKVEYGELNDNNKVEWKFTDENPLVGMYGRQTESGISQLGFITLDTACQLAAEQAVEPVEPTKPTEPTDQVLVPEQPNNNLETTNPEKEGSKVAGLDTMTFTLICVGVIVFIALLVVSLCTLRYKKNQQNRVASPVVSNTVQRKRDSAKPAELRPNETDVENSTTPAIYGFESAKKNTTDKTNNI